MDIPDDASCIVIEFGLNGTGQYGATQTLINDLLDNNPGMQIYVLRTSHVASDFAEGDSTADSMNGGIDLYNDQMKTFCDSTDDCTYIDPNTNICEDNGEGYLKDEYKDGTFHLNWEGNEQWYEDIIEAINDSGAASSTTSSALKLNKGVELYSFSTNVVGYVRYMTEIENVDMYEEKALYTFVYVLLVWINVAIVILMFVRMAALWILAIAGPLLAVVYAIDTKNSFPINYRIWVSLYVVFALVQTILAIAYRIILETAI